MVQLICSNIEGGNIWRKRESEQREKTKEKEFLLAFKKGKFYVTYEDDSKILSYLFGYKIGQDGKTGFPETALEKVKNKLEDSKINYQLIFKDKDPYVRDYKNFNCYNKVLNKSLTCEKYNIRIKRIIDILKEVNDIDKLDKLLGVIENELSKG